MIHFGLCCIFRKENIHFKTTTARYLTTLKNRKENPLDHIDSLILENVAALRQSIEYCATHGIGTFRVTSRLFPLFTHPEFGYRLKKLPHYRKIVEGLHECKSLAKKLRIRLTFHPDQFVVLNSLSEKVVTNSIQELEYHALVADLIGADVLTLHAGGRFGDKKAALERFQKNLKRLSQSVLEKLALENDEINFSPVDLLPLCKKTGLPLVYDVHHHRLLPDSLSIEEASIQAYKTWGKKEPLFHISSPKTKQKPRSHHDYINPKDFPESWFQFPRLTIEIEAKAKEVAIFKLKKEMNRL